jgi:hypothetical protein
VHGARAYPQRLTHDPYRESLARQAAVPARASHCSTRTPSPRVSTRMQHVAPSDAFQPRVSTRVNGPRAPARSAARARSGARQWPVRCTTPRSLRLFCSPARAPARAPARIERTAHRLPCRGCADPHRQENTARVNATSVHARRSPPGTHTRGTGSPRPGAPRSGSCSHTSLSLASPVVLGPKQAHTN